MHLKFREIEQIRLDQSPTCIRYCISKIWDTNVLSQKNVVNVASDIAFHYQFLKQSDNYFWRFCILKGGHSAIAVALLYIASARRVSTFNSTEPYNVHAAAMAMLKTIISHNTAFGAIITNTCNYLLCTYMYIL